MVHIGLADLPQIVPTVAGSAAIVRGQPGLGAAPGIIHGLAFVFEGQPYEVRFSSVAADPSANNLRQAQVPAGARFGKDGSDEAWDEPRPPACPPLRSDALRGA